MNRIIYVSGIIIMWAAYVTTFYLLSNWEFFRSIIILFLAAAVALGYGTLVLIIKAVR